jgi:glyoxylase-like metal-dependent hydrolase (beta-lactamase superfamily II)
MFEVKRLSLPPIQTNCCVLMDKNKHEAIVIDPASNGKYIFDFCQSKELKVSTILLTHGHFDHIGGVDELVQLSGCKVFIHKNDAEMLDVPDKKRRTDECDTDKFLKIFPNARKAPCNVPTPLL